MACLRPSFLLAQSTSDNNDSLHGVVINSVTREPISRALVSSPGNGMAVLTNSEGRFEFALPRTDTSGDSTPGLRSPGNRPTRSYSLMARKPGFLTDPNNQGNNIRTDSANDVTLALIPEAVIAGTVSLPTSEAPDSIDLQIFRRQVQDGRARWVPAGGARSMSDGQFRFADLPAGTYKLVTSELLDTDPVTAPHGDPFAEDARGPLFGYPPLYYQNASDFGSATTIRLGAGQTQSVNLSLVKQTYHRVKIPVIEPASDQPEAGFRVIVYAGEKGPGFSLGYNPLHHAVEGMLPNGVYSIEVASSQPNNAMTGLQTIAIKNGPAQGPGIVLRPNGTIAVNVREEFANPERGNSRGAGLSGPRRYLNVTLEPADDFGMERPISLRDPANPGDDALVLAGAPAGRYWVRVQSSRGYAASIHSGALDLQHRPLVVGVGGGASPIEITMRDDMADISGTVEGMAPPPPGPAGASGSPGQNRVRVYCIPLPESSGQFTDVWVHPDGTFDAPNLAPGTYRVLAYDRVQNDIEYRNPEAMQAYESKGTVVRVAGGGKEHVAVQLISTAASGSEQNSDQ
jgi:hypothetical protein